MVSDSQGLDDKMRDELAKNQAAMGLLCLSGNREGTFRNLSAALPTATSSAHVWNKTEEEKAILKMQLKRKDSLQKDMFGSILGFVQQLPSLLEHLKDMLPSTGPWSEGMRQDMIYRIKALQLELETPRGLEYDWNKYQEKIKLEMQCLGNAIKMITERPYNNNMETGEEENVAGDGGDMIYEMSDSNTISIVDASSAPPPPPSTATGNTSTSAADKKQSEEQGTSPRIHEHCIDKSKAQLGYFCTCSMEFRSKDDLVYHIKVGSASTGAATTCTSTACNVCFSSQEELIAHRKNVHKISPSSAELEMVSLNQAPVRRSRGFQSNSVDNTSSNSADLVDSAIQELIGDLGGPVSGDKHAVDDAKSEKGAFYCICGQSCPTRNSLQHHTWYRTNVDRIKCDFCPRTYPGYSYLSRHQYSAHRYTPPSFPNANGVAILSADSVCMKENLERPISSSSGSSRPHHPIKKGAAAARTNRPAHGIKQREGIYQCLCKETFKKKCSLENHIKIFTRDPALPCKICDDRFYNVKFLKRHMKTKHGVTESSYMKACYDCSLVFEENHTYIDHLRSVHKSGPQYGINKVRNANRRKLAKLEQVNHGHQLVVDLVEDDDTETSDGRSDSGSSSASPPACYCTCGMSFPSMAALNVHARELASKLVFKCDWCTRRFHTHAALKNHIRRFHKEQNYNKKFGCNQCGATFRTRQQLMTHRLQAHRPTRLFRF